jgi:hypothetical protein
VGGSLGSALKDNCRYWLGLYHSCIDKLSLHIGCQASVLGMLGVRIDAVSCISRPVEFEKHLTRRLSADRVALGPADLLCVQYRDEVFACDFGDMASVWATCCPACTMLFVVTLQCLLMLVCRVLGCADSLCMRPCKGDGTEGNKPIYSWSARGGRCQDL